MITSKPGTPDQAFALEERRAFMKLPVEERRRQLAEQASQMAKHYEARSEAIEREGWQGGDIVECS